MKDFKYWEDLHKDERLDEFSTDATGLLWLKTKSIIRKELVEDFITKRIISLSKKLV
jgi:hypothetical protein